MAGWFAQLGENAERTLGVEKRDPHMVGAGTGSFVDHAQPGLLELGDPLLDALDREGDVVKSLAAFFQECRDGAGGIGRFQQLEADVADAEEADADLLIGDRLDAFKYSSEGVLV